MHRRFVKAFGQKRNKSLLYCTLIAFIYLGCIVNGKHIVVTKLKSGNYYPVMEDSPDVRVSGAVYFTEEETNE